MAHATLVTATPPPNGRFVEGQGTSPKIVLQFSEPVQIINRSDVTIVDARDVRVDAGRPSTAAGDPRRVLIPLKGPLVPSSYTVRYRVVSSDSHTASQAYVFGVGNARLGVPILAGSGGLSDSSPAAVAARVVELVALGLLVGLLAFRMLVWGPAVARARGLSADERETALAGGQRAFWRSFWALAVLAAVGESAVLAAKSAVVFHTGLLAAAVHPTSAYRLVAASRFGDMLGWRSAALVALIAAGFITWTAESAGPASAGRRVPHLLMGLFGVTALTLLASQGHASQAPLAPLSIAADAAHLSGAAIWVGGLPCLIVVLLRAPRALPDAGRALASATLVAVQPRRPVVGRRDRGHGPRADGRRAVLGHAAVGHGLRPRPHAEGLAARPDPRAGAPQPPARRGARRRPHADRRPPADRGAQRPDGAHDRHGHHHAGGDPRRPDPRRA